MATNLYPDISHYHPVKDWAKVKKNCPFLISKATEGTTLVDSTLEDFIAGCEGNKIPYWLYVFLRKGNELDQAKYLVSTCKSKVGDYFVGYVLDVEKSNTASDVKAALDYLSGLGVKTMLYTMYSQYDTYKSVITARPDDCAFWEARYGENDGAYNSKYAPHSCDLHQYTSQGTCAGISGNCDLNRIAGTAKPEEWFKTANEASEETNEKTSSTDTTKTSATAAASSPAKKDTLTVDGKWGTATCKRAQEVFNTTQDGYISGQPTSLKKYHAGISCAKYAVNGSGSQLIKAIQKKVGVTQDGKLGPVTIKAMQKWLGTTQDGTISNPSQMVKALQKWLNKQ